MKSTHGFMSCEIDDKLNINFTFNDVGIISKSKNKYLKYKKKYLQLKQIIPQ